LFCIRLCLRSFPSTILLLYHAYLRQLSLDKLLESFEAAGGLATLFYAWAYGGATISAFVRAASRHRLTQPRLCRCW